MDSAQPTKTSPSTPAVTRPTPASTVKSNICGPKTVSKSAHTCKSTTSTTPSSPTVEREPGTATVHASLEKRLRVSLTDNRTIEGTLECFDNSGNMILSAATDVSASGRAFRIGTVLVPGPVATRIMRAQPPPGLLHRAVDDLSLAEHAGPSR